MPDTEVLNPPPVAAPATADSFADFLDTKLGGLDLPDAPVEADPAKVAAEAEAAKVKAAGDLTPVIPVTPVFQVPEEVTKKLVGGEDVAKVEADKLAARETELVNLLKTKPGEAFKGIKDDLANERKLRAEETAKLRAELEEVRKKPAALPEDLAKLKAEADDLRKLQATYEQELSLAKVEATREYKENVTRRYEQITATVAELAKRHNVAEGALIGAIREGDPAAQDKMLAELAAPLPERDRMKLYNLVEQFQQVVAQDKFVRENAKQALAVIEERKTKETESLRAAAVTEYAQGIDSAWNEMQAKFPFLKPVDGQASWNNSITELQTFVKQVDVDKLTPTQRAQLVTQGASLPLVVSAMEFYANEVVKLREELQKNSTVRPGAGGGAAPASTVKVVDPGASFLDVFEAGMSAAR